MELIDDLNTEIWSRGDPNETTGYQTYRLMKCEKTDTPGNFIYAVFDEQGFLKKVLLGGGAGCRDPLTGVSNIQLRLSPDEKKIEAIIVEDDCVKLIEEKPAVISNGGEVADGENQEKADTEDNKETTETNTGDDDVTEVKTETETETTETPTDEAEVAEVTDNGNDATEEDTNETTDQSETTT